MINILMVCLGNICRSPLAEGILKSKLPSEGFYVDSAGTASYHIGASPDKRSVEVAKKHGLNISNLRGRQLVVSDFDKFDYIYVMDASNYQNAIKLARNEDDRKKVKYILNEVYPNQNFDVPDPYYGGDEGFQNVYNMLEEACEKIANDLRS
ncbi:low molecular weight phosphotyrosine protein phosphatase [Tamlana sp. s12]|uniref:low molecular weight protein-tyrosine-phosphatase n=1 Tax=Tamlana sp. s12 TaxID=1630406 RepID=UPI0007FF1483|nr:low molecular weight protein-tyrosine-phosphatase [Tamlana sp. s12]OBQ56524.1 protein tyrosine phosphatase [Tamlana sp. s12]QQY81845.1 low molecular weight phosphotyrosine protein phosphatase [Tamlana sp. s12]